MATVFDVSARLNLDQSASMMDVVPVEPDRWRDLFWTVNMPQPFRFQRFTGKGRMVGIIDQTRHPHDGELVRFTPIPGKHGRFHCMIKPSGAQLISTEHRPITGPCVIDVVSLERISSEPLRSAPTQLNTDVGIGVSPNIADQASLSLLYLGPAVTVALLDGRPFIAMAIIALVAGAFVLSLWFDTPLARMSRWPMFGQIFFASALLYANVTDERGALFWLLTLPFWASALVGFVRWVRGFDDDLLPGDQLN